jgi:hypothetical protein
MQELGQDALQEERQNLMRALTHIEAEEAAGLLEGSRNEVKGLLILRIAQLDDLLGTDLDH